MNESKDIIIVAAAVAGGKTTAVSQVMQYLEGRHIPYNPVAIRDVLWQNALEEDHRETGGRNHYHAWCKDATTGHAYNRHDEDYSWTITGYPLVRAMWREFTQTISDSPKDGRITVVEWSGGRGNPPDRSYGHQVEEFENGTYDGRFIPRILGVIHPVISYQRRVELNNYRLTHPPSLDEIHSGTASWALPPEVMDAFKDEDFDALHSYLEKHGVQNIYDVENDARIVGDRIESHFPQFLDEKLSHIFPVDRDIEGGARKEIG